MRALDHLRMVQAVQPFVDTAISKTVNVPADYPFDDFRDLYSQAMEMDYASSAMPFEEYLDVVGLPQWHGVEERNS